MGFGCPICSERLDKLPAEAQGRNKSQEAPELNISATPCGHIFHAYCIQKWLSGNLASSKQCPCCRKDVPRLRCLSLFPTTYDDSFYDDSMSQAVGGSGAIAPCNHGEVITSLKNQIARLDAEVKDKETMHRLLTADFEELEDRFRKEKMSSDTWMMRAKQYQSFEDLAREWEAKAQDAENRLRNFTNVENMLRGVERTVDEELTEFPPCSESIRSLLEMKHVMTAELRKANSRLTDFKAKYDEIRNEKQKLCAKYRKQEQEFKSLQHVFEISKINGRIRSPDYPVAGPSSTPTAFRTKRRLLEPLQRSASSEALPVSVSPGVDSDVDVFPGASVISKKVKSTKTKAPASRSEQMTATSSSKTLSSSRSKSKSIKLPISLSPISPPSATFNSQEQQPSKKKRKEDEILKTDATINLISSEEDEEDNFRIRGNVPGAALPISSSRIKNLEQKSDRTLGLSKPTKKFNFTKKPSTQSQ